MALFLEENLESICKMSAQVELDDKMKYWPELRSSG